MDQYPNEVRKYLDQEALICLRKFVGGLIVS